MQTVANTNQHTMATAKHEQIQQVGLPGRCKPFEVVFSPLLTFHLTVLSSTSSRVMGSTGNEATDLSSLSPALRDGERKVGPVNVRSSCRKQILT